ncbi:MAG: hypothetical protein ACI4I9_10300 [Porcipelethomonas sp.]
MKQYKADKKCLNIIRIFLIAVTAALIIVCAEFMQVLPILMISLCVIFALAGFFTAFVYLPVYFRKLCYTVSDGKIIKQSGFFFYKTQMMRIDTIQFSSSVFTPFSKFTGLNFIFLYAYGGMMTVMFLENDDFSELDKSLKSVYAGKEEDNGERNENDGLQGASAENN